MKEINDNSLIRGYNKFADFLYLCTLRICQILMIVMVFSISYAVVGRFILSSTPKWCEEVGIICLVWLCFLSATMAIKDGNHIRMTLLEHFAPENICKKMHFFAYIVLLIIHLMWIIAGWQVIVLTKMTKLPQTQLPMGILYASVFVAGIIGTFMTISRLMKGDW